MFKIVISCCKVFLGIWTIDGIMNKGISRPVQLEASVDVIVVDVLVKIKFESSGRREMDRSGDRNEVLRNFTTVEMGERHLIKIKEYLKVRTIHSLGFEIITGEMSC